MLKKTPNKTSNGKSNKLNDGFFFLQVHGISSLMTTRFDVPFGEGFFDSFWSKWGPCSRDYLYGLPVNFGFKCALGFSWVKNYQIFFQKFVLLQINSDANGEEKQNINHRFSVDQNTTQKSDLFFFAFFRSSNTKLAPIYEKKSVVPQPATWFFFGGYTQDPTTYFFY